MIMLKEKQTNLKRKQKSVSNARPKEESEINKSKNVKFLSMTGHCSFLVLSLAISKECLLLTKIKVAKWGTPLTYFCKMFVFMNSFEIFL
jgi:hypothetical protein